MSDDLDIEALYRDHGAFIARAIERRVGRGAHVDDLLQETFVTAFRQRQSFDLHRAPALHWLFGIARNLSRRHQRSQRRFWSFAWRAQRLDLPLEATLPDAHLEQAQAATLVRYALGRLPGKQREVFALYELEGLEGEAIAALLNIPLGTVWTRLHHARKAFAKTLRRRLGEEV